MTPSVEPVDATWPGARDAVRAARAAVIHGTALDRELARAVARSGVLTAGLPAAWGGGWQPGTLPVSTTIGVLRGIAAVDASTALLVAAHTSASLRLVEAHAAASDPSTIATDLAAIGRGVWWGLLRSPGRPDDETTGAVARGRPGAGWTITAPSLLGFGLDAIDHAIVAARTPSGTTQQFVIDFYGGALDGRWGVTATRAATGRGLAAVGPSEVRLDAVPARPIGPIRIDRGGARSA